MDNLTFALYGSQSKFIEDISPLLKAFEAENQIQLQTVEMALEEAWDQLFNYTIHGGGPDLARIGTIWTGSLVSLNALRPFKPEELDKFGGPEVFFRPIWRSGTMPGDPKVWGIPLTSYFFLVYYRKDLFEQAGIDTENGFSSAEAMLDTLKQLQAAGIQSPWVITTGEHLRGRLHILANWIWGAGGHFLSENGKKVLLNEPAALQAMQDFFNLHRYLSPSDYGLTHTECQQRFARGQAAMWIAGPDALRIVRGLNPAPGVIKNISVAALPGIPWIGGSSLVVWKDVLTNPVTEKNINNLISFLTEKTTQIRMYELSGITPARSDALLELELDPPELLQVKKYIMETGRSYRPDPIWLRLQNDLVHVLDQITEEFLDDLSVNVLSIIRKYIDPIVKRYNLILSAM